MTAVSAALENLLLMFCGSRVCSPPNPALNSISVVPPQVHVYKADLVTSSAVTTVSRRSGSDLILSEK